LGAGQEEDVSLHALHVDPRYDLDVGVGCLDPQEVLFAVVFAGVHLHELGLVCSPILEQIVVAWYEVVEFLHVLDGQFDS
jgi:hypothetical protein